MADTGLMLARIRGWFDGAGWFPGLAAALFVFALLAVLLELQSSDSVRWTGQSVTGTEIGGIVSYRWDGQTYSLSASGYGSQKAIGVVLDPATPPTPSSTTRSLGWWRARSWPCRWRPAWRCSRSA